MFISKILITTEPTENTERLIHPALLIALNLCNYSRLGDRMFFQRIFNPGLAINSYLIGDEKTKRCAVIDPSRHVVPFIVQAQNAGLDITDILETHVHADYVSGARELKHQLNEKPRIYCSGFGGKKWIPSYADVVVNSKTIVKFGEIRLEPLHTPGHTPEHIIWVCYDESRSSRIPWFAFTGDCLLVGSIGRPDLLGEKELPQLASQLYYTIFEVLAPLPDFLEIHPGHGEGSLCGKSVKQRATSTLGYERLFNSYLQQCPLEEWIKKISKEHLPIPPYFHHLKKKNLEGPSLLGTLKSELLSSNKKAPSLNKLFLLDIRHPEVFAAGHIKGAINIPLSNTFCHWAGWMLPFKQPIGLIVENTHVHAEIIDQLRLMGFDQKISVIHMKEDHRLDCDISSFPMIDVEELAKQNTKTKSLYILDVRTPEEWLGGHIPGSSHLELIHFADRLKNLPDNKTIALLCKSGQRASLAASLLQKNGFTSVMNIRGGMQAWKQAGLPLESSKRKKH